MSLNLIAVRPASPHALMRMQVGEQERNGRFRHGGVIQAGGIRPAGGGITHDVEQVIHPSEGDLHQAHARWQGPWEIIWAAVEDENLGIFQWGALVTRCIECLQGFLPRGG